jgi:preprotein translocase subunit SecD
MLTFARWKYFVILLVLVVSVIYALPNAYPQDPSVQISAARSDGIQVNASLAKKVESLLSQAKIPSKSIKIEDQGNLLVRLEDTDQQTRAADLLRPQLGNDYVVALSLAPTAPAWLEFLRAKPMPRGLDLQGGVHFVMQVDQASRTPRWSVAATRRWSPRSAPAPTWPRRRPNCAPPSRP